MSQRRVDVHVEELVLHGLSAGDVRGVEHAVERELARLLAGGGAARVDAGSFELGREPVAHAVGTRVAARLHRSVLR
jgi:hypothetical protein